MLILAFVAEFGSLRAKTLRLQSAFDRAALAASGAIDAGALARGGELRLDAAAAEATAREYLAFNLESFEGSIPGLTAAGIAATAQVRSFRRAAGIGHAVRRRGPAQRAACPRRHRSDPHLSHRIPVRTERTLK